MTTREAAQTLLEQLAGPTATLRDDQWTAIESLVVHRRRALVVQRTGWGKSAVYFIAAKLLREAGRGATVIVSPLLALMRNQVAAAERAGVHAATINSSNITDWDEIHERVRRGDLDVLLVSPERLNNPDFRDQVLPALARDAGLVVVDEAHCVSDWGHDFRPDYRRIRTLIGELGADVPVLATTATANDRVVDDVATQLGVGGQDTLVLRGGLDRESLRLSVVKAGSPAQRAAWLAAHIDSLPGSGIVYTLTVAQARDVASLLGEHGHKVAAYTGSTEAAEREQLEADLLANRVKALVATSALGMGFDKPDLGFVVHLGAPSSPDRLLPAGRPCRAVDGERRGDPAARSRGSGCLALFRLRGVPVGSHGAQCDSRSGTRPSAVDAGAGATRRPRPVPVGDGAEGARRRRRGAAGQGRLGRHGPAVGLRRAALPEARRGAQARTAGHARLSGHRRLPDGVSAWPTRRSLTRRERALRSVRQLLRSCTCPPTSTRAPRRTPGNG